LCRFIAFQLAAVAVIMPQWACQSADRDTGELRPLPDPRIAVRQPPIYRPAPKPAPQQPPAPRVSEPRDEIPPGTIDVAALRPKSGVRKNFWRVIVVHHSAMRNATPKGMDSFHRQRGWENGLGYHFVIGNGVNYPDGQIFVGDRWKRQIQGAHCATKNGKYLGVWRQGGFFNDHGIGICLIGNFENEKPTAKQLASLRSLTEWLCLNVGVHSSQVYGHGEVTKLTACPGKHMSMNRLRTTLTAADRDDVDLYCRHDHDEAMNDPAIVVNTSVRPRYGNAAPVCAMCNGALPDLPILASSGTVESSAEVAP
jgi:hypothetical protein